LAGYDDAHVSGKKRVNSRIALAEVLCGQATLWPAAPVMSPEDWLDLAHQESVVALAEMRMRDGLGGVPEPVQRAFSDAARSQAAQSLLRQAEARRVLALFSQRGIPVLLLKGSALAYWLYSSPHLRHCVDVDLLFETPEAALRAAAILAEDGYVRRQHFGDAATAEFLCRRELPGRPCVELDMHWALSSAPVFAQRFAFAELMAASQPLPALSPEARGLGPAHACLHACLHRMSDLSNGGQDRLKWLYDLHLLAAAMTEAEWELLAVFAADRGLSGVCVDGLDAAALRLHTVLPPGPMAAMRKQAAREPMQAGRLREWAYFQRQNLRALPGWRARLRWIWQRLLPTAHYREDVGVPEGGFVLDRFTRAFRRLRGS